MWEARKDGAGSGGGLEAPYRKTGTPRMRPVVYDRCHSEGSKTGFPKLFTTANMEQEAGASTKQPLHDQMEVTTALP